MLIRVRYDSFHTLFNDKRVLVNGAIVCRATVFAITFDLPLLLTRIKGTYVSSRLLYRKFSFFGQQYPEPLQEIYT